MSSAAKVAFRLRHIRERNLNWGWNYGPENMWEAEFQLRLGEAQQKGDDAILKFLTSIVSHARKGRYILKALRLVGKGTCDGEYGTMVDLFLQGMALAIEITSEVKFFEVKIEELVAETQYGGALKVELLRELVRELSEDLEQSEDLDEDMDSVVDE